MEPQKVRVLAQEDGQIIALQSLLEPEYVRYEAGTDFVAQARQVVHEVDVPQELVSYDDITALHRELLSYFQVEDREGAARLIRKRDS